jgi:hypothetical protein
MRRRRPFLLALALAALSAPAPAAAAAGAVTTNAEKWNLIVGFLLPPVIALLKQSHWPAAVQSAFAFLACLAVAVGTTYWQTGLNWSNWTTSALTILVAAVATYEGFWKPTGIAGKASALTDVKGR